MKNYSTLIILFSGLILLTACEKEEEEANKFAPYTVEQNKQRIQNEGLAMINEARNIQNLESWTFAASMTYFMNLSNPFGDIVPANRETVDRLLKPISIAAAARKNNPDVISRQLKSVAEDSISFMEMWDSLIGVYTWNAELQKWNFQASGTEIRFLFPSTPEGTQNNAEFRIFGFEVYNGIYAYTGETVEMPTAIHSELKVNNVKKLGFDYVTTINNQGYVTSVTVQLSALEYTWAVAVAYNPHSKASFEESLRKNNQILIGAYLGFEGNFEQQNINLSIDNEVPENILHKANAKLQLMNILLEGMVNFQNLASDMRNLDEQMQNIDDDSVFSYRMATIINNNSDMYIRYADNNTIIALVDFMPFKYVDTYVYYYWDNQLQQMVEMTYTYTYWDVKPRFTFADGSSMDADTFFETGFDNFITELNSFSGGIK